MLSNLARKEDTVTRYGDEEFMVLLPSCAPDALSDLAERIRKGFADRAFPNAGHCTMSLGTAIHNGSESSDEFCMRVDSALYQAKNTGKNKVVAASDSSGAA